MFRSPTDASSSEESSSESNEEIEIARVSSDEPTTAKTSNSPSQHAGLITASLLEFHYTVRAAEILNVAHQRPARYDRHSPEAKALAKKMFANGSQLLASHGMLAEELHSDELKDARQAYLRGLDNLGLGALSDDGGQLPTPRLALEAAGPSNLSPASPTHPGDFFLSTVNQIAVPSLPCLPDVSRYGTEFTEIKQLGRGGFGTVYHVRNFVDGQHYAIKKIGLDPRRLKRRWQKGGQNEMENILREIRTLASLEHSNIVRYFGAWIEAPLLTPQKRATEINGSQPLVFRQLLENDPANAAVDGRPAIQTEQSSSYVTSSGAHLTNIFDMAINSEDFVDDRDRVDSGADSIGVGATSSTISLSNDTDIFTDGDGRQGRPGSEDSPNQIILCLQMSLHQLNLAKYLSPEPAAVPSADSIPGLVYPRHCFHLRPSIGIFLGILSGVEYLHSAGIVHRDLKPANIFLSEDTVLRPGFVDASCPVCPQPCLRYLNARIGDFGLVGNTTEELSAAASTSDKVIGTEFYRPPSCQVSVTRDGPGKGFATNTAAVGTRIDEKIDVFALGVLLFELLWRMETKMERFMVLNTLTRSGTLPADFGGVIDHTASNVSARQRSDGEGGAQRTPDAHSVDEEQRVQNPESVGNMVADCIAGMMRRNPSERWDCARVRKSIESVRELLERSA